MWRSICLGTALALMTPVAAEAADPQSRYAAHGLGRVQCKRFIELCEGGADECKLTGTWISGYLTAFNALDEGTFDILPWQAPELVAEGAFNLCKRNPDVALVEAVTEVVRVLRPQRITTASERVRIGDGDRAVFLYRQTVRELQERLLETGHLKGKADGAFGPGTKSAVESFQKAAGLEASGIPDQRTLVALFYNAQAQAGSEAPQRGAPAPAKAPAEGAAQPGPKLDLNLVPSPQ